MTGKHILFIIAIMALILTSCSKKPDSVEAQAQVNDNSAITDSVSEQVSGEDTDTEQSKDNDSQTQANVHNHEGQAINPLTGLYISEEAAKRRPIGIMINNLKAALPQSGIGQADIMYETLVEGGICRLFAVFQDFDAKKIGPLRSSRHYYLDFAFDLDAIYVHYGWSPQAEDAINKLGAPNLNGLSYLDSIMCFQDTNRVRPHSTYTSYDGLMAAWDTVGYDKEMPEDMSHEFSFSDEEYTPQGDAFADSVILPFSYYQTSRFEFDKKTGLYKRFQFDQPQIDVETNEQLTFKNIIIQFADIWAIPGDTYGRLDMTLIGSGNGYFISNGKSIPITWEKTSHYKPTKFYLEDGSELLLNKGKTWISIFPNNRKEKIEIK